MPHLQMLRFVNLWSAPPPFLCSGRGTVQSRCGFTLSSSGLAACPRGKAGPWEGNSWASHPPSHSQHPICKPSKCHLMGPPRPLNQMKRKHARLLGWQSWVYTDGRVSRDHRTNTSNQPISHFWKKRKEWQRRAKANRLWKTWRCGLEFSAVPILFALILGSVLPLEKQDVKLCGLSLPQKEGSSLPITKQALFPVPSAQFPWLWVEDKRGTTLCLPIFTPIQPPPPNSLPVGFP